MEISVVIPTYLRSEQIRPLMKTLINQTYKLKEIIFVDGAPIEDKSTEDIIQDQIKNNPKTKILYVRSRTRGSAIQRNVGIDIATGDLIAFIDDDMRLSNEFFEEIVDVFNSDDNEDIGGVSGYIENLYRPISQRLRWRILKKFNLLGTFEPSKYDYTTGVPINKYLQPPFTGTREVDFISGGTVWRKDVFNNGLKFDSSLTGYAIAEDVMFALMVSKNWKLVQCGTARLKELSASGGRENPWVVGVKTPYNYKYLFLHLVGNTTKKQEFRFYRFHLFAGVMLFCSGVMRLNKYNIIKSFGYFVGIIKSIRLRSR